MRSKQISNLKRENEEGREEDYNLKYKENYVRHSETEEDATNVFK